MTDIYNENDLNENGAERKPAENLSSGERNNSAEPNTYVQNVYGQNAGYANGNAGTPEKEAAGRAAYGSQTYGAREANAYYGQAQSGANFAYGGGKNYGAQQNASRGYGNGSHSYTWGAQNGGPGAAGSYGYASDVPTANKKAVKERKGVSGGTVAIIVLLCLVLFVCGIIGGALLMQNSRNIGESQTVSGRAGNEEQGDASEPATIIKSQSQPREFLDGTVAAAVSKAYDSVVVITTETIEYDTFYGQYINGGAGSGVIISENGYIVTCAHVIEGANTITVTTTDGRKYNAEVVGYDDQTDVGVVKIDAEGLTFAVIGDSDKIVIGETSIAIGNPLGTLGGTVTSGIISALDREIEIDGTLYNLLQTNAEINPGNSGGGLFNIDGELIGVVNAKSSGSGIEGLGFAIPVNNAIDISEQLINNGYIKGRPALGITVVEVSEYSDLYNIRQKYPKLLNYITDYGVYVLEWKNGDFEFGDRIIAIDDVPVSSFSALKSALAEHEVGETVKVTVSRLNKNNQSRMTDVEVTLTEAVPENISQ